MFFSTNIHALKRIKIIITIAHLDEVPGQCHNGLLEFHPGEEWWFVREFEPHVEVLGCDDWNEADDLSGI